MFKMAASILLILRLLGANPLLMPDLMRSWNQNVWLLISSEILRDDLCEYSGRIGYQPSTALSLLFCTRQCEFLPNTSLSTTRSCRSPQILLPCGNNRNWRIEVCRTHIHNFLLTEDQHVTQEVLKDTALG